MGTLGESLKDVYAADEVRARGRVRDPRRTVGAVRRRRTVRAAGTGTVAVLGVGAVGAIWMLAPGGRFATPASPAASATCSASIYVPPNMAARGDVSFAVRTYVDLRPDSPDPKVVAVLADGTATEVLPDAAGDYTYVHDGKQYPLLFHDMMDTAFLAQPIVFDYDKWGNADFLDWDGVTPHADDYKWTTVVPAQVPEGIDTEELSMTLADATLGGGLGYIGDSVPNGAYADAVLTTSNGVQTIRLKEGDAFPTVEDRSDIVSVALRVGGLPGGETFSIVSTYDADGAPPPACEGGGAGLSTATSLPFVQEPQPSAGSNEPLPPGVSEGPSVEPSVEPTADTEISAPPQWSPSSEPGVSQG